MFNEVKLSQYLQSPVVRTSVLGENTADREQKQAGYGTPMLVEYETEGSPARAVLHTMGANHFGHEHMSDRAQILLWQRDTFNRLPHHIRALDVGAVRHDGSLISLGAAEEFFLLTEYAEGSGYFLDLERIAKTGDLTELDLARADALCDYLADIHSVPGPDPGLYVRRIRELVGHGECIMGIVDSYTGTSFCPTDALRQIEHLCVDWRWRLKNRTHRLKQVHGDFHPWNILFADGTNFTVLDRSRGEFGDPADDIACLTINYLFFSLERSGRIEGAFEELFQRFFERYMNHRGDAEIAEVIAPFFVFRALVLANPVWYPKLDESVRQQLFRFSLAILGEDRFDPAKVNRYCG